MFANTCVCEDLYMCIKHWSWLSNPDAGEGVHRQRYCIMHTHGEPTNVGEIDPEILNEIIDQQTEHTQT